MGFSKSKELFLKFLYNFLLLLFLLLLVAATSTRYEEMLIFGESYFEPSFAEKWKLS